MSIASEITRLQNAKSNLKSKLQDKGVSVGNERLDEMVNLVDNIQGGSGTDTTDATATASDILLGKTAYVKDEKIEGTIETYDGASDVGEVPADLIEQLNNLTLETYSNENITSIKDYLFYNNAVRTSYPYIKLKSINIPNVTYIGMYAFNGCQDLENVNCPNVNNIKQYAFYKCKKLKSMNLSNVTDIGQSAFYESGIEDLDIPLCTSLGQSAFSSCFKLKNAIIPLATTITYRCFDTNDLLISVNAYSINKIDTYAFNSCKSLKRLVIEQTESVCNLSNTNALNGCYHILGTTNSTYNPNGDKDGYIYVPASLLSQYKVATNWATYETQIIGHQDFNVGDTLPSYANDTYTTCTWYSDETLTQVVTSVETAGRYYCRLEA